MSEEMPAEKHLEAYQDRMPPDLRQWWSGYIACKRNVLTILRTEFLGDDWEGNEDIDNIIAKIEAL